LEEKATLEWERELLFCVRIDKLLIGGKWENYERRVRK